jgi:hypothetical protein
MGALVDLTGQKSLRLTVLERLVNNKHKKALWKCLCECGTITVVLSNSFRRATTRSCGCLKRESAAIAGRSNIGNKYTWKHGHSKHSSGKKQSASYNSWLAAKQRCLDPNQKDYPNYGGANPPVTICDRWKDSFENFLADMGERPAGTTLGRLDDRGNYEPGNCAWQTSAEQANNRRPDRKYANQFTVQTAEQIAA